MPSSEMVQVVRVADEIRKYHRDRLMDWLTASCCGVPPIAWCGRRSTSRIVVVPGLRAAAAHSRHARGADGAQRRLPDRPLFPVAVAAARDGQLGDPQPGRATSCFAIIVLFQADIRRALAHFGRAPFFRYFERATQRRRNDRRARRRGHARWPRAASARSSCIERQIGLRNYIEGGIPLDATITYDLLASIFQPASPLHDGAVIVQGDRIAAAACFLPLSVNPRVSRELGTRHRAALGLTEENDAIAIVVSEETGTISLAIGGRLERGLSAGALRDAAARAARRRRRRMRRADEARSSLA